MFMLSTGARVGEACGMKWEDVDLERKFIRIVRRVRWDHFNKKPFLKDVTKTAGSARLLMLPKKLQDILRTMKKETVNDLVFTDKNGELLKHNAVQSAFNAGFTALRLPGDQPISAATLTRQSRLWRQETFPPFKQALGTRSKGPLKNTQRLWRF